MSILAKSACWAAMLILLAAANRAGLIADASATTLFAVIPALWVATSRTGTCRRRGEHA